MSTTIIMPNAINAAIQEIAKDAMSKCAATLAEKYGFDLEEANRFLDIDLVKVAKKRGPSPKTTKEPKEPKGKGKAKKEDDGEPKKKRAPTGYLMFSAEVRPEVKQEMTEALEEGDKLKPQDVVKAIARKWKDLDEGEREEWVTKAKAASSGEESE